MGEKKDKKLRSASWFSPEDPKSAFIHRSWMRNQGLPTDYFEGRPVIGICNTWSELTPCNAHLRDFAEYVKKGVLEAGGVPYEFPVTSCGEILMRCSFEIWPVWIPKRAFEPILWMGSYF